MILTAFSLSPEVSVSNFKDIEFYPLDAFVNTQNFDGKEKNSSSRRASPEE